MQNVMRAAIKYKASGVTNCGAIVWTVSGAVYYINFMQCFYAY